MTRLLVLGAGGFLGRHATALAGSSGLDVVAAPDQADLDLAGDPAGLLALLRRVRPDAVLNAAGLVAGSAAELDAGNRATAATVVAACAAHGADRLTDADGPLRLVHLGSLAEYGPGSGEPFREDAAAAPVTPYGCSKLAATAEVVAAGARGEVDAVVLRVANPVGPGMPASTLVGSVLAQLRSAPDAPVRVGPLTAVRDVVSARDVAGAVLAAVRVPRVPPVVNVGTGRGTTMAALVAAVLAAAGHTAGAVRAVGAGSTASVADVAVPDVALAATALGWTAADDLDAVARAAVADARPVARDRVATP